MTLFLLLTLCWGATPQASSPGGLGAEAKRALSPLGVVSHVGRGLTPHMQQGLTETKVGEWVTYQLHGGEGRTYFWRIAIVGEEKDRLGRDAFWMEIEIAEHHEMRAPISQLRMLVAKSTGLTPDGITRLLLTFGYEKPQELADDARAFLLKEERGGPGLPMSTAERAAPVTIREGKPAKVMTLAGTVSALPVEVRVRNTVIKRYWMSRQIPVFRLAKLELPAIEHSMEIRDYGVNAKPMMVLPAPDEPKIRMERLDQAFPPVPPQESSDE